MQKMKPLTARAECTVFALFCLLGANLALPTSVGVTNAPAQTAPQGKDPPGNDNDPQATPSPSVGKGGIRPPENRRQRHRDYGTRPRRRHRRGSDPSSWRAGGRLKT